MNAAPFRLRVAYAKQGRLRHLGHLELIHAIERCVRRSGLPFALTQGFSPRMKIQFSGALPTGASSVCEYYDVYLEQLVDAQEAFQRLLAATPPDIAPVSAAYVERSQPALEAWLRLSRWTVELVSPEVEAAALTRAIEAVVAKGEISYMRGTKPRSVKVVPSLRSWEVVEGERPVVAMEILADDSGTLRPSVLVGAALDELGFAQEGRALVVERRSLSHLDEEKA